MGCVWPIAGSSLSGNGDEGIVNSGALDPGPYGMCLAYSRKQFEWPAGGDSDSGSDSDSHSDSASDGDATATATATAEEGGGGRGRRGRGGRGGGGGDAALLKTRTHHLEEWWEKVLETL